MTALQNKPDRVVPVMTTFIYDHKLKMAFQCAEMIFLTLHAYQLSQLPKVRTGEHDQLIRDHFDQFLSGIRADPSAWVKWASDFIQALT